MGCCGKKRAQWLKETKTASTGDVSESKGNEVTEQRRSKVFRYTGDHSIVLRGINSGRIYHFRFPGDTVEVAYEDSFAMMAERDLSPK